MKSFPAAVHRERASWIYLPLIIGITLVPIWPILRLDGPPYPRHDWVWPILPQSLSQILAFATSAWSPQGLGSPNLYPTIAPLFVAMFAFSKALGPHIGLDVFVALVYLIAALGAFKLTSLVRPGAYAVAVIAAAAYICSPVFADQLVAGHLADLVALAGLPWLAVGIADEQRSIAGRVVLSVFGAALCVVQVQFLALMPCAVLIFAAAVRRRRAAVVALCAIVAGALVDCTTLYQMIRVHGSAPLLDNERTVVAWEVNQSASLHDAFAGQGYFAHYASVASLPPLFQAVVSGVDYAVPAALLAAFIFALRRNRLAGGLLILYVIGLLILSGLKGPGSAIWSFLFVHVSAASVMRELFHAAGFVALPIAVVGASAMATFRRPMKGVIAAALLIVLICVDAPALASIGQSWLTHPVISAKTSRLIQRLAKTPNESRAFIYPGRQPVMVRNGSSGVDPLEHYPVGSHAVFFNYFPIGIDALASDLVLNGRVREYTSVLGRMSVGNILWRPEPRVNVDALSGTTTPLRVAKMPTAAVPHDVRLSTLDARPIVYGAAVPLLVPGDYSRLFDASIAGQVLVFMRDAPPLVKVSGAYRLETGGQMFDQLISRRCGELMRIAPSVTDVDPHSGWVKSTRFGYADPALDYPVTGSVVTQASHPKRLAIPADAEVLFAVLNGSRKEDFSWGRLPDRLSPGTALAVAGYFRGGNANCMPLHPALENSSRLAVTSLNREKPTHVRGTFRSHARTGTIVFTDAYDLAWQLRIDGALVAPVRHFRADGFGNGWVVSTTPGMHVYDILYGVQRAFGILTGVEFAFWLLIIVGVVLLLGKSLLSVSHE